LRERAGPWIFVLGMSALESCNIIHSKRTPDSGVSGTWVCI
jgi:hypothetical protein